jgi:hypothetical protein
VLVLLEEEEEDRGENKRKREKWWVWGGLCVLENSNLKPCFEFGPDISD